MRMRMMITAGDIESKASQAIDRWILSDASTSSGRTRGAPSCITPSRAVSDIADKGGRDGGLGRSSS